MNIKNLAELDRAKALFNEQIESLHNNNKDLLVYAPNVSGQRAPRHLYVITTQAQLDRVQLAIDEVTTIKSAITEFFGDGKRRNNLSLPVVLKDVIKVRIWLNVATSSRAITKHIITERLERYLEIAGRYPGRDSHTDTARIASELDYFRATKETEFVIRSVSAQDVTTRIYYSNNDEQRTRLTMAGIFVVGDNYKKPKIFTPPPEKVTPREGVYANLTPIPYFGAPHALLYKKSEADIEKLRINFDQDALVEKKKAQARKPKSEAAKD
jgi:hypothetical protein